MGSKFRAIVTENGEALENALVIVDPEGEANIKARTDGKGTAVFEFDVEKDGSNHQIVIVHPKDNLRKIRDMFDVYPDDPNDDADTVSENKYEFSGVRENDKK